MQIHSQGLQRVSVKQSPFLVVRQLDAKEVRVYSKLHGNLTSYDFDIDRVLALFASPVDVETAAGKIVQICQRDPSALVKELCEKRFLIGGNRSQEDLLSEYVESVRSNNAIPHISKATFLISAKCNLACKGCYHNFYDFKNTAMSGDFARKVLDRLFPYLKKRAIPTAVISFLGYEPLLNFGTLSCIHDRACRLGEEYGIKTVFKLYTNAFQVSEEILKWIGESRRDLGIKVSLDGVREDNDKRRVDFAGRGTYDRIIKNLERIMTTGVECGILTVLSKLNLSNIERFVDEMAGLGIKTISANIFCGQSGEERLIELTEREKFEAIRRMDLATEKYGIEFNGEWKIPVAQMITGAQFFCPAGTKQLVFSAEGVIYPCQRFAGTEMNFGNYGEDFWEKLLDGRCARYREWSDDLYQGVAERTRGERIDLTGCSCPFLPFVRGECISKNLEREFNEYLLDYYITRPMNRILRRHS